MNLKIIMLSDRHQTHRLSSSSTSIKFQAMPPNCCLEKPVSVRWEQGGGISWGGGTFRGDGHVHSLDRDGGFLRVYLPGLSEFYTLNTCSLLSACHTPLERFKMLK